MPWRAYTVLPAVEARPSVPPSLTRICPTSTPAFLPSFTTPPAPGTTASAVVLMLQAPPIVASPDVAAHVPVTGNGRSTTVALHDVVDEQDAAPAVLKWSVIRIVALPWTWPA